MRTGPSEKAGDPLSSRWSRLEHLGDAEANETWEWFVRGYEPFVRGMLEVVGCRQPTEAGGAVWGYLFTRRGKLTAADRGRKFRPFLTGFIRNFVRERQRGSREKSLECGALEELVGDAEPDTERLESKLWAETVLGSCLDWVEASKPKRGAALRLFYGIRGGRGAASARHSVSEVAAHLGVATSSVSPMLTEARRMLRHALESHLRETVLDENDLGEEIGVLAEALRGPYPGLVRLSR
jgi:hypothetical protein